MLTEKPTSAQSLSPMNVDDLNNMPSGEELVHRIPGTPFSIVTIDNEKHLLIGQFKVCRQAFKTSDEIYSYIEENMWDIVLSVACIAITSNQLQNEQK